MYLTIRHKNSAGSPLTFSLIKGTDEGSTVTLKDPMAMPVEGFDGLSLQEGLRWYLEDYPSLRSGADDAKAVAVTAALRRWGSESFNLLFDRNTYLWYQEYRDHLEKLCLRIESESPEVLSWPWEALCATLSEHDTEGLFLGTQCSIERRVSSYNTPRKAQEQPDVLRMLLVIARPYGDRDVDFHAVSRAVVDYVRENRCPVEIDLLRPPTFDRLCQTLSDAREAGRPYHIVHFDGHGGYGSFTRPGPGRFQGAEGCLAFETEPVPGVEVTEDPVGAGRLAQALSQCGVSSVVLNACQSAMVDKRAESAYASVAAALLRAGIPSVTAMGYVLYVSGAKLFVPAFYRRLFRDGAPSRAIREGRAAMSRASGRTPEGFQDWLVPQLYQSTSEEGRLLPQPLQAEHRFRWENVHLYNPEAGLSLDEYGLIGRGKQILELERLLHRPQAGILVYGMAGAGKTTLVRGFLRWLRDTGGLHTDGGPCHVVWLDFRDQFSASGMFHYLASELVPGSGGMQEDGLEELLIGHLKQDRAFVVWDNFESVHERMPQDERDRLRDFLDRLRGGRSKVLITSRSKEGWLGTACARAAGDLAGLEGDELWDFCRAVAGEHGFTIAPGDEDLRKLVRRLGGSPLSLRAVLSRLGECSAAELYRQLDEAFAGHPGEEGTWRLRAAFRVVRSAARPGMQPVLELLGLHEHFADAYFMELMLARLHHADKGSPERVALVQDIRDCFGLLERAGLCAQAEINTYRVHPALRSCLAGDCPAPEEMKREFVRRMCAIESLFHNDEAKRRAFFGFHETNLSHALSIAEKLDMKEEMLRLLNVLAVSADDRNDYRRAESLCHALADEAERQGNAKEQARAYSRLHIMASNRGDEETANNFAKLEDEVLKKLDVDADALFRRGEVVAIGGDFSNSKSFFEKALEIWEAEGEQRKALSAYGLLGTIAAMQGDQKEQERRLRQCLKGAEQLGYLPLKAGAHRSLASLEEDRKDLSAAEDHYLAAILIYQQLHDRYAEADAHRELGDLYNTAGKLTAAKEQFIAALALFRQLDRNQVEINIARCYEGLGDACRLEGSISEAKLRFKDALEIFERRGQEEFAALVRIELNELNTVRK